MQQDMIVKVQQHYSIPYTVCIMIKRGGIPIIQDQIHISYESQEEQLELQVAGMAMMSTRELKRKGEDLRDQIANNMWRIYQTIMTSRLFIHIEDN